MVVKERRCSSKRLQFLDKRATANLLIIALTQFLTKLSHQLNIIFLRDKVLGRSEDIHGFIPG